WYRCAQPPANCCKPSGLKTGHSETTSPQGFARCSKKILNGVALLGEEHRNFKKRQQGRALLPTFRARTTKHWDVHVPDE
ncbi:MAG: hypothetical protein ACKV2Q_06115, partial [Planctomycetaceae bacterium]